MPATARAAGVDADAAAMLKWHRRAGRGRAATAEPTPPMPSDSASPAGAREADTIEESAALELEAVSHRFGSHLALDRVSLSLRPGDFTVLLGPNGAGKTTLFALATRLYALDSGSIRVFGRSLQREPAAALRRLGAVFQQRTLDLDLTVAQNLLYHADLHGLPRAEAKRMAEELERIGLAERARDRVRQLSGGQLRRVEIARALLHRPRLLLCDEATVGLDIDSRRAILEHLRRLVREEGLAVLWATHLVDEVVPGNRVALLHRGRLRAEGEVGRLLAEQGQPDVGSLFATLTRDAAAPA